MDPDHIPPPPYSETDPGSLTPATSQAENPSPAAASSVDETIYTPPYSPTSSVHRSQTLGDELNHVSSSSATAYFESRPALRPVSGIPEVHRITITARTEPNDLPYPPSFLARDCTDQDWATFVNYLLPSHAAEVNNEVADRKLHAEHIVDSIHSLSLSPEHRSKSDASEADAQLEHLRQQSSSNLAERLRMVGPTISEWNEGFFKPRGLQITTTDEAAEMAAAEEVTRMPDSWIPWWEEVEPESSRGSMQGRRGFFGFGRNPFMDAGSQGFRMGPIVANNEGFRIGNSLVANNEGFRLGNVLVSDQNGFRLGGSRGFIKDPNGVSLGGRTFGRRESYQHPRGLGQYSRHHRGRSLSHGRRGKGRSSSSSSFSSSSSSDSDSSFGSLPDCDDLKDQQLPIAKQSLMEWLSHCDQVITKQDVQLIRKDIKAAKKESPSHQLSSQDLKTLRSEVKDLFKMLKERRKSQKRQKKEARRERRAARRLERKERRTARRGARRGKRAERRMCDHGGRPGLPWTAYRVPGAHSPSFMSNQPPAPTPATTIPSPAPPTSNTPAGMPGFPFARAASVPFMKGPPFGRSASSGRGPQAGPFGIQAMHGGWPFTQGLPYAPGRISVPNDMTYPTPISNSAEDIHIQALQMEEAAKWKESRAIELRTAATGRSIGEKQKLKSLAEATHLEEEAENHRIEADRLRAEALHLDGELARELEEDGGQASGIIRN